MPCKSFGQQFAEAAISVRGWRTLDRESRIVRPRWDYYAKDQLGAAKRRRTGRQRLADYDRCVIAILECMEISFGEDQIKLFKASRAAELKKIVGNDVLSMIERLTLDNELDDLLETTAIRFPRRAGKTVTSVIIAVATALSQPNGNVVCCNIYGRQSREWLAQVFAVLDKLATHPEFGFERSKQDAKEFIEMRPRHTDTVVRISAFPGKTNGSADNLRGMGRNTFLVVIDEYEFLESGPMEIILPIAANGAAIVLISSHAKGQQSGAGLIMNATWADGRPAVRVLKLMRSCTTCMDRGRADRCTHMRARPQHFQSRAGSRRLKALMSPFPGAYERELMNVGDKPLSDAAFDSIWIDVLKDETRRFRKALYSPCIITTVDPAGGGSSDAVVLTCAYWTPRVSRDIHVAGVQYCVILGAERIDMGPNVPLSASAEHIADHINACRRLDGCAEVTALVCVENNMVGIAPTICDALRRMQRLRNVKFIYERRKRKRPLAGGTINAQGGQNLRNDTEHVTGSRTWSKNKPAMIEMLMNSLREQRLQLHEKFAIARPSAFDDLPPPLEAMLQQLRGYQREIVPPPPGRMATGHNIIRYTGKTGQGRQDDFVMALSINLFVMSCTRLDSSIVFD